MNGRERFFAGRELAAISEFSVRRRVTVLMGVLVVLLLGAISLGRISIDLFPRFDFPAAAVITEYPGAGPAEVENLVTRVVEEVMGRVARVNRISSVSLEERSVVIVQFEWNTNMDLATLKMREKLDLVGAWFPEAAGRPVVTAFDPSSLPVMFVTLTGPGFAPPDGVEVMVALRDLAEDTAKKQLERVEGVASVTVIGGARDEILIAVDRDKLAAAGVNWAGLRSSLGGACLDLPGGTVSEDGRDYLIRSIGELERLDDLKTLIVGARVQTAVTPAGPRSFTVPVRLGDVAEIGVVARPAKEISRLDGAESIILSIQKASDANSVAVSRRVTAELDRLRNDLPDGVRAEVTMNQADFISRAVGLVGENAWQGALLAVLVLLLFLREVRSVIVIGLAIPISVVATFVLMYFSRLTLNLLTVGGLALGVGMLVDNSIVVLENIFRHLESGASPREAAVEGAAEVSAAITASTVTTIVVFLPVVFVGGIAGTLFKELAITVSFSLLSSLIVALTFVPMAAATVFSSSPVRRANRSGRRGLYPVILQGALRSRLLVMGTAVAVMVLSLRLIPGIGAEFVPSMDRGEVIVSLELPAGSAAASTDTLVRAVETIAGRVEEARFVTATVGSSGGLMIDAAGALGSGGHLGSVTLRLADRAERDRSAADIVRELDRSLFDLRGARITVESLSSFMSMGGIRPIELVISGPDPGVLEGLAAEVARVVQRTPGTVNIDDGMIDRRPEIRIAYERDALAAFGLHPAVVASTVREAFEGTVVGAMTIGARDLDLVVRYADIYRQGLDGVEKLTVAGAGGTPIPLSQVAAISRAEGPSVIQREGGRRVMVVSAGVEGRDLASVSSDITAGLKNVTFPEGYEYRFAGEHKEMEEAFSGLGLALLLSMILVYMVMAAQFESLSQPLVIMLTLPLAAVGVLLALRVSGITLSVPSFIGIIMLGGLAVNNAIVLLDFAGRLRRGGMPREEAVITAARTRLRPILMTTATTALGLVPMAFASLEGSELANSLAVAVIGGLMSSSMLTLVVIPVFYVIVDDLLSGLSRLGSRPGRRARLEAPDGRGVPA